jgi:energy-coupling factor transporter ATP-binding protein EcfA2
MNDDSPQQPSAFWSLFTKGEEPERQPSAFWGLFTNAPPAGTNGSPPPGATDNLPRHQGTPSAVCFHEDLMFWALRNLPVEEASKHLAMIGATGSGKTTLIRLFLQSIAPRSYPGQSKPEQLIVFDGQCNMIPLLASMGLREENKNVYILNPYDERGIPWDLADGTQSPLIARHLAALLVPEEPRSQAPFFANSARDLVYAVILGLSRTVGVGWSFRDLIIALDSSKRIRTITARHPRAKVIAARILNDRRHAFGVLSHIGTRLVPFEQVAALWHSSRNPERFRIKEFLEHPGVLVLGNDPVLRDSLWPINALLLKALTQEILRCPLDLRYPRHWFVLDEFPAMEKVDCIHELLRRGRSKGASVLLGMQTLEALMHIYQENPAEDILSQCAYKTFLRAGGPKTAEWAERFFGKLRRTETTFSESWGKDGHSYSVQYNLNERSLFLSSVFMNMPLPTPGGPLIAISDVPCLNNTVISRRWFDQLRFYFKPPVKVPAVLPRDYADQQTLKPWEPEEESYFCGRKDSAPKPAAQGSKPSARKKPKRRSGLPDPGEHQRKRK